MDVRKALYQNIVLSGASTMFPGFSSRLELDLKRIYKEKILKNEDREAKFNIGIIVNILLKTRILQEENFLFLSVLVS
jgi:actin-related protein